MTKPGPNLMGTFSTFKRFLTDWRTIRIHAGEVLAMNRRNLHYIYPNNPRSGFPIADDKLLTKELLVPQGVPMPQTYLVYSSFFELRNLEADLAKIQDFVIKPARGRQGGGIIVITGKKGGDWLGISGKTYSLPALKRHISDIIFGIHSFDMKDRAIIESRLCQLEAFSRLSPLGLADIRVILHQGRPVMAMTRLPTRQSDGKANLHQGAVGVGIHLKTGKTNHAIWLKHSVDRHPDTQEPLLGEVIPQWQAVLKIAVKAADAVPLKYLGVDISLTTDGPVLLEINARPGLEIQNANLAGLARALALSSDPDTGRQTARQD